MFEGITCKWCGGQPVDLVEKFYPQYSDYVIMRRIELLCAGCAERFIKNECAAGCRRIPVRQDRVEELRRFFEGLSAEEARYNMVEEVRQAALERDVS